MNQTIAPRAYVLSNPMALVVIGAVSVSAIIVALIAAYVKPIPPQPILIQEDQDHTTTTIVAVGTHTITVTTTTQRLPQKLDQLQRDGSLEYTSSL